MRKIISALLLLLILCMPAIAKVSGRISLSMKGVSIEKVLDRIEKDSGYRFSYSKTVVDLSPTVSINVKNASIDEVLYKVFEGTGITYSRTDGLIVLSLRKDNSAGSGNGSAPARCVVKGTVTNHKGEPLMGAVVMAKGTGIIADTGSGGEYEITVDHGVQLEFSLIGFRTVVRTAERDGPGKGKAKADAR